MLLCARKSASRALRARSARSARAQILNVAGQRKRAIIDCFCFFVCWRSTLIFVVWFYFILFIIYLCRLILFALFDIPWCHRLGNTIKPDTGASNEGHNTSSDAHHTNSNTHSTDTSARGSENWSIKDAANIKLKYICWGSSGEINIRARAAGSKTGMVPERR